jgi:hypothetical protein
MLAYKHLLEMKKIRCGSLVESMSLTKLCSLILGHRLVLIYARCGAGKTSIINAKIALLSKKFKELYKHLSAGIASGEAVQKARTI